MELQLQTITSSSPVGQTEISEMVFGKEYNEALIHQVVTAYMAAGRSGTKAQKTRSEVRGGGKKPWNQKGGGRARAGTSRGPLWRSGGQTFAAKPRDYSEKVNRKMYRGAMRSILSELVRKNRLVVVENFEIESPKTKLVIDSLKNLGLDEALIICSEPSENLIYAFRNIPNVGLIEASTIDPVALVTFKNVVVTRQALTDIESMLK
jgi:large subunit ribosomal protein L4